MVLNGTESYIVVTFNIKNFQLDDIKDLPVDEHIIPVNESGPILPLSLIDVETCLINVLDEKIVLSESNSSLFLQDNTTNK